MELHRWSLPPRPRLLGGFLEQVRLRTGSAMLCVRHAAAYEWDQNVPARPAQTPEGRNCPSCGHHTHTHTAMPAALACWCHSTHEGPLLSTVMCMCLFLCVAMCVKLSFVFVCVYSGPHVQGVYALILGLLSLHVCRCAGLMHPLMENICVAVRRPGLAYSTAALGSVDKDTLPP